MAAVTVLVGRDTERDRLRTALVDAAGEGDRRLRHASLLLEPELCLRAVV